MNNERSMVDIIKDLPNPTKLIEELKKIEATSHDIITWANNTHEENLRLKNELINLYKKYNDYVQHHK